MHEDEAQVIDLSKVSWKTWILCIFIFAVVIYTIIGNIIVIMAFVVEKKLRTTFNLLILNLAITDFTVAAMVMTLYSVVTLIGFWPFGEVMCGVWIFTDYGMTFASKFTMVAISLDRCWCVLWSIHYRAHNNNTKMIRLLVFIWTLMICIWLPPLLVDRLEVARDRRSHWKYPERNISSHPILKCQWEPADNMESVFMISIVGNHAPDLIIFVSYIMVLYKMKSRIQPVAPPAKKLNETKVSCKENLVVVVEPSTDNKSNDKTSVVKVGNQRLERQANDRKCFITLSYIILTYAVCWLPFHFTFDLMAFYGADVISGHVITFTFWMAYFNSSCNPLVYALSNREFRAAFKRVVLFRWSSSYSAASLARAKSTAAG